ncbi:hypothetical protein S1R3Y_000009 [Vibrio phage vB_ValP_VA-RY-3]|nr:hypothetical protein S1R3Y_000009 [Vibrio phage vB_ValP_VA-RY-3]
MYSIKDIDVQIKRINRYIARGAIPLNVASAKIAILARIKSEIELTAGLSSDTLILAEEHNIHLIREKKDSKKQPFSRKHLKAENTDALGRPIKRRVAVDELGNNCYSASEELGSVTAKPKRLKAICDVDNINSDPLIKRAYKRWYKMIEACCETSREAYICEDWLKFSNYLKWYKKRAIKATHKVVAERFNGNLIYSPAHTFIKKVSK